MPPVSEKWWNGLDPWKPLGVLSVERPLTHICKKSDKKFSRRDVLRAASVAADRSENERAVRISKMPAYVKRGTQQHKNIVRLCDAWLAWSFQASFMFEPTVIFVVQWPSFG
jgi:hypothetical protein